MEPELIDLQELPANDNKPETPIPPVVYSKRDWKEYIGESFLIIFSVLLALILTEYFNGIHEKENTRNTLKNIVAELSHNRKAVQEMQRYNLQVVDKIDSTLVNSRLQNELITNDEFHLKIIAPQGVLYRYLNDEAWSIAKGNNMITKVDVETVALLTKVYEDQARMMKVEEEVAKIIFSRDSRDPKQAHRTLVLIRDIYLGWAVDRAEGLLQQIDSTIKKVEKY